TSPSTVRMKVTDPPKASSEKPRLSRRAENAGVVLHLRDHDRDGLAHRPPVDVPVDVGPERLEEILPGVGRAAGKDDDLRRIGMDGRDEEPSEIGDPDAEFVAAEAVSL